MTAQTKIAAVVINWNQASQTIECVRSLEQSANVALEIMVVDNGSSDNSAAVIRGSCPNVLVLENGQNLGYAGGCNRGIREALDRGYKFVLVMNEDAVVALDALALLVEHIEKHPDVGICGPMIMLHNEPDTTQALGWYLNTKTGLFRAVGANEKNFNRYKSPTKFDMVSGCVLLMNREMFSKIGMFDESYFYYFDEADLCFRARRAGFKIVAVPEAKVYHKHASSIGGSSSPARIRYSVRNHLRFLDKNVPAQSLFHDFARKLIVLASYKAFVVFRSDVPKIKGIWACLEGLNDYLRRRTGPLK